MATASSIPAHPTRATGPKTAAGKNASKYNRLSHGLTSDAPVVPGESPEHWDAHRDGIRASLRPVGLLEIELADRIAGLLWRLHRVSRYETAVTTAAIDHAVGTLTGEPDPNDPFAHPFGPDPQSVAARRTVVNVCRFDRDQLRD